MCVGLPMFLVGCGGGGGDAGSSGFGGSGTPAVCAGNATATIDGSIADVKQSFGGLALNGQLCRPLCDAAAVLTMQADGSGGSVGNSSFTITSVCKNAVNPDRYFVSGVWADKTPFVNALFLWQAVKVQNMTLPAGNNNGYFTMF